jgi:signal peptidase I
LKQKYISAIFVAAVIFLSAYAYIQLTAPQIYVSIVEGTSMEPTLHAGDKVYLQVFPASEYVAGSHIKRTGDIIGYNATIFLAYGDFPYTGKVLLVLHRVVGKTYAINHYWFQTQGDNDETNPVSDEFSWAAYGYNFSQPYWWGQRGWLIDSLTLGKLVEVTTGGS